jgi:hypothetical protein
MATPAAAQSFPSGPYVPPGGWQISTPETQWDDRVGDNPFFAMLGQGHNSLIDGATPSGDACVYFDGPGRTIYRPQSNTEHFESLIATQSERIDFQERMFSVDGGGVIDLELINGEANGHIGGSRTLESRTNRTTTNFVASVVNTTGIYTVDGTGIARPGVAATINGQTSTSRRRNAMIHHCGDRFVREVTTGGFLLVELNVTAVETHDQVQAATDLGLDASVELLAERLEFTLDGEYTQGRLTLDDGSRISATVRVQVEGAPIRVAGRTLEQVFNDYSNSFPLDGEMDRHANSRVVMGTQRARYTQADGFGSVMTYGDGWMGTLLSGRRQRMRDLVDLAAAYTELHQGAITILGDQLNEYTAYNRNQLEDTKDYASNTLIDIGQIANCLGDIYQSVGSCTAEPDFPVYALPDRIVEFTFSTDAGPDGAIEDAWNALGGAQRTRGSSSYCRASFNGLGQPTFRLSGTKYYYRRCEWTLMNRSLADGWNAETRFSGITRSSVPGGGTASGEFLLRADDGELVRYIGSRRHAKTRTITLAEVALSGPVSWAQLYRSHDWTRLALR